MIDRLRHSQDLAAVHLAQQSQPKEPAWRDVFSGALDDTVVIEVPSPRHARQDETTTTEAQEVDITGPHVFADIVAELASKAEEGSERTEWLDLARNLCQPTQEVPTAPIHAQPTENSSQPKGPFKVPLEVMGVWDGDRQRSGIEDLYNPVLPAIREISSTPTRSVVLSEPIPDGVMDIALLRRSALSRLQEGRRGVLPPLASYIEPAAKAPQTADVEPTDVDITGPIPVIESDAQIEVPKHETSAVAQTEQAPQPDLPPPTNHLETQPASRVEKVLKVVSKFFRRFHNKKEETTGQAN